MYVCMSREEQAAVWFLLVEYIVEQSIAWLEKMTRRASCCKLELEEWLVEQTSVGSLRVTRRLKESFS